MRLAPDDLALFFALQSEVNNFIYARMQQAKGLQAHTAFRNLPLEKQLEVRTAFSTDHAYLEQFAVENPAGRSADELDVVRNWRHMVTGRFFLVKHLKKHTILLDGKQDPTAYGVLGLGQEIEEVIGPETPIIVDQVILLPFRGQIVYDGLLNRLSVSLGPGVRRTINDSYRAAKERGLVTSLPAG